MAQTGPRPWIATVLALLYPGLGHVYIRSWGRAILWFALTVGTTMFIVPEQVFESVDPIADPFAVSQAIVAETPTLGLVSIFLVIGFSTVDAYLTARRMNDETASTQTHTCPECGRQIDEDLSFCPWCATELDTTEQQD